MTNEEIDAEISLIIRDAIRDSIDYLPSAESRRLYELAMQKDTPEHRELLEAEAALGDFMLQVEVPPIA